MRQAAAARVGKTGEHRIFTNENRLHVYLKKKRRYIISKKEFMSPVSIHIKSYLNLRTSFLIKHENNYTVHKEEKKE